MSCLPHQDQKAHEAIFRVLKLSGLAREPVLDEWTGRAELCDKLHEPVGSNYYVNFFQLIDLLLAYSASIQICFIFFSSS